MTSCLGSQASSPGAALPQQLSYWMSSFLLLPPREITAQPASSCSFIKPRQSSEVVRSWPQSDDSNVLKSFCSLAVSHLDRAFCRQAGKEIQQRGQGQGGLYASDVKDATASLQLINHKISASKCSKPIIFSVAAVNGFHFLKFSSSLSEACFK